MSSDDRALHELDRRPRLELAHLPTPLTRMDNLRRALDADGPELLLKHDHETGFALGGNKVRKLEFELAPPRLEGVTHLITTGGPQSNHARVTAAAAAALGLECILVLNGEPPDPPRANARLHRLFGADIRTVSSSEERNPAMEEAAREVERSGGRARILPLGASTPVGALGYVRAARELASQLAPPAGRARGGTLIVVASSSCGTLGGLAAGFALLGRGDVTLRGVSADVPEVEVLERSRELASAAMDLLGSGRELPAHLVTATDAQVGEGYGIPTEASDEATRLFARNQGVVLDPVYSAKAAAEVVRTMRDRSRPWSRIIFIHTGGHPVTLA